MNVNRINITAHAGCMGTEMDSLESLEAGIKYGAHILEIDLNIDGKGELVLCHDKPRLDKSYINLIKVLEFIVENKEVSLNIDIKDVSIIFKLNKAICDFNLEARTYYTGLNYFQILYNKEVLFGQNYFINLEPPKLKLSEINNKTYLSELAEELMSTGIIGINIYYKLATSELIEVCREKGLLSSIWTVDEEEDMKIFISKSVNSITTKNVEILKRLTI